MRTSTLRDRLGGTLLEFAWDEWAQMGIAAAPTRSSPWTQDPEALLVFSLEVARDDPRLFDGILDWLVVNHALVSVRRLRTMCVDEEDVRLVEATLGWLNEHRPRARLAGPGATASGRDPAPLFRGQPEPLGAKDAAFERSGVARPATVVIGKAQRPDLQARINFAFRLRHLLGVGARAEIVRFLLTEQMPRAGVQVVTRSAGYAKRNVQEGLTSLHAAGVVSVVAVGGEQRYAADREGWARLLGLGSDRMPLHRDWPQLLGAARTVLRWLADPELEELSEYLFASRARDLLDDVRDDLAYAGVVLDAPRGPPDGGAVLAQIVERISAALRG